MEPCGRGENEKTKEAQCKMSCLSCAVLPSNDLIMQPGQMENLMMMLEEELNYSKKQSRSRINALMREADHARSKVSRKTATSLLLDGYVCVCVLSGNWRECEEESKLAASADITGCQQHGKTVL